MTERRPKIDTPAAAGRPDAPRFEVDLLEHGAPKEGTPQTLDRRLFCQLQVFTGCHDSSPVIEAIRRSELQSVVYASVNDPLGIGVLTMAEDPDVFVNAARSMFLQPPFTDLDHEPDFTMLGRSYAGGREKDLEDWLLHKPRRNALNPELPWAIWYPLRRTGAFNRLERAEQGKMMAEHALIGRAYGESGHARDIRLECHGLDRDDNEFILGIIGAKLYPLSKLIKDMRGTRQTAEFMEKMGPFFIGRVLYQSPMD